MLAYCLCMKLHFICRVLIMDSRSRSTSMTPTANYMGNCIVQFLDTMGIAATSELQLVPVKVLYYVL